MRRRNSVGSVNHLPNDESSPAASNTVTSQMPMPSTAEIHELTTRGKRKSSRRKRKKKRRAHDVTTALPVDALNDVTFSRPPMQASYFDGWVPVLSKAGAQSLSQEGTGVSNLSQAPPKPDSFVMFEAGSATTNAAPDVDLTSDLKGNNNCQTYNSFIQSPRIFAPQSCLLCNIFKQRFIVLLLCLQRELHVQVVQDYKNL